MAGVTAGPGHHDTHLEEGSANAGGKESDEAGKGVGGTATAGGGPGGEGALAVFAPAPGAKPATFFELLAAAAQASRSEKMRAPDFLEYLRKSGIKMAWIRAVVALYEEPKKPDDPLAYIVAMMGLGIPESSDVKRMQDQVTLLRAKVLQLQGERSQLRQSLDEMEAEALKRKESLMNLYDRSQYFSEYNSDDDDCSGAEEMQQHRYSNYNICHK